jgi:hypothetical protein
MDDRAGGRARRVTPMQLPFTEAQFLDAFAGYNRLLWPGAVALWTASVLLVVRAVLGPQPMPRVLSSLLAVHFAWSAGYHVVFFAPINPAAWLFAGMFAVEAALFVWLGVVGKPLQFRAEPHGNAVAYGLIAYSLAYPMINTLIGLSYPRMPTFGVPCPTTIFTAGMLLLVHRPPALLLVVPVLWSFIGGSAAFLLGVGADLMLPVAGTMLLVHAARSHQRPSSEAYGLSGQI